MMRPWTTSFARSPTRRAASCSIGSAPSPARPWPSWPSRSTCRVKPFRHTWRRWRRRRGSKVEWQNPDGSTACDGEIVEIDAPRRLVTTWRSLWAPELAPEVASRVTWEIEERADGCVLRVTHDRLDHPPKTHDAVSTG